MHKPFTIDDIRLTTIEECLSRQLMPDRVAFADSDVKLHYFCQFCLHNIVGS